MSKNQAGMASEGLLGRLWGRKRPLLSQTAIRLILNHFGPPASGKASWRPLEPPGGLQGAIFELPPPESDFGTSGVSEEAIFEPPEPPESLLETC